MEFTHGRPVDRGADSAQTDYRGPLSMYLRAGFEPYRETKRNIVAAVRRQLGNTPAIC